MSKSEGKSEIIKPGKQFAKSSSTKAPAQKRTHSDVSPNCSMEELTVLCNQMEELSEDVKSLRGELKSVMKKDQMETFIKETVTQIISDLNENLTLMIEIKTDEKIKPIQEKLQEVEDENKHLRHDILQLKNELKSLKTQNEETEKRSKLSLSKANYNEQYSRKNNLKILNIKENQSETEEGLKSVVCTMLQGKGVDLDSSKILAIHRIPGKQGHPRPVLMKVMNNNEKTKIMKKRSELKTAGNRLVDDVTHLNTELISRLLKHKDIGQAWYFNGSVFAKTVSGTRHKFDIFDDIDTVLRS